MKSKIKDINQEQLEEIISKVVSLELQKVLSNNEQKTLALNTQKEFFLKNIGSFLKICITTIIESIIGKWIIF